MAVSRTTETDLGFRSIRRVPAAAGEVIATIKAMILDGQLGPFQRLPSEKELAEMLGVSRPTIREAVRGLMTLNIVESRHGDGTYITSLDPALLAAPIDFLLKFDNHGLQALTDVRIVLESGAAEMAATKATPADVARMQDILDQYLRSKDAAEFVALDIAFHEEVARTADSPILLSLLSTVTTLAVESRTRTPPTRKVHMAADSDHRLILAAIERRDPAAARTAMVEHLGHAQRSVKRTGTARRATA